MSTILNSVKTFIGMDGDYDAFDGRLLIIINGLFGTLNHEGVLTNTATVTAESDWSEYCQNPDMLGILKQYVSANTMLKFDTPPSNSLTTQLSDLVKECEWRLFSMANYETKSAL